MRERARERVCVHLLPCRSERILKRCLLGPTAWSVLFFRECSPSNVYSEEGALFVAV